MHVGRFLHKLLASVIHKARIKVLSEVTEATINIKQLTLTAIARELDSPIQERSAIQKVNRLLGNESLLADYDLIAKQIAHLLIGKKIHPEIIVDWSKYSNSDDAIIRAALAVEGRALTIYEERHSIKKMGNRNIQIKFLQKLKQILPTDCKPVIVTDAGFHNDWFRKIISMNWEYVGRVRGIRKYCQLDRNKFMLCSNLFKQATKTVKYLGKMILTKQNSMESYFYIVKGKLKGRKAL